MLVPGVHALVSYTMKGFLYRSDKEYRFVFEVSCIVNSLVGMALEFNDAVGVDVADIAVVGDGLIVENVSVVVGVDPKRNDKGRGP